MLKTAGLESIGEQITAALIKAGVSTDSLVFQKVFNSALTLEDRSFETHAELFGATLGVIFFPLLKDEDFKDSEQENYMMVRAFVNVTNITAALVVKEDAPSCLIELNKLLEDLVTFLLAIQLYTHLTKAIMHLMKSAFSSPSFGPSIGGALSSYYPFGSPLGRRRPFGLYQMYRTAKPTEEGENRKESKEGGDEHSES